MVPNCWSYTLIVITLDYANAEDALLSIPKVFAPHEKQKSSHESLDAELVVDDLVRGSLDEPLESC